MRKPPLPRQASSNDESLNEKVDVIRRAHAERQAASRAASSDESEGEETSRPRPRIRIVCRAASITRDEESTATSAPPAAVPIPVTHFAGEHEIPAWLARRRQRFQRSRTNPDLATQFCSQRVQQLLQERSSRLDSSTSTEEERRIRRRSASREANEWRARGCPRTIFGRKGAKEGELNWPRGVCAIGGGAVAVCDSSNHRVCVFDREGKFLRQFGGYGTGRGQLDSAAGIAMFKQKLIVSDRYNHRVCIFDMDGNYLNSFGGHGQSNGKFNNPWGVAVDELGTIYVADKVRSVLANFNISTDNCFAPAASFCLIVRFLLRTITGYRCSIRTAYLWGSSAPVGMGQDSCRTLYLLLLTKAITR